MRKMENIIQGKNCLVTGAAGGIGKEIVKLLAEKGCNLFLTSKNSEKLQKFKNEIDTSFDGLKIEIESADLGNLDEINNLVKKVAEKFSSIDILINCAGIFQIKSLEESSIQDYENSFNLNVRAPFILCKEFSKKMIEKKWGRIINFGSSSSYSGFKNGSIYCATKHSILGLSRALNSELKSKNVRVSCISPASTKTDMAKISTDQDYNTFLDPKEVAEFVLFAISFDKELTVEELKLNRMELK